MKILVTGSNGFIGKNLVAELKNRNFNNIFEFDKENSIDSLDEYCKQADFIYHLAGINRPNNQTEYMVGNYSFTSFILDKLKLHNNHCPILFSSSIQAELDNPYGLSKKADEEILFRYGEEFKSKILVYRLPNIFGKWCKPNYNSVIATFCHNIASNIPIQVNDSNVYMNLVYIDDVVDEIINALEGKESKNGLFYEVKTVYKVTLRNVLELIYSFKNSRETLILPDISDSFIKKLYSTYLSYLPKNQFSYFLKMNMDIRGSLTEFIKTLGSGQVSVNVSKPEITKGNHWHRTKIEKFLVVSGIGIIRFRRIDSDEVFEYYVSGERMEIVDVPPGYAHSLENLGKGDLITIIWANEIIEIEKPDTNYSEVLNNANST